MVSIARLRDEFLSDRFRKNLPLVANEVEELTIALGESDLGWPERLIPEERRAAWRQDLSVLCDLRGALTILDPEDAANWSNVGLLEREAHSGIGTPLMIARASALEALDDMEEARHHATMAADEALLRSLFATALAIDQVLRPDESERINEAIRQSLVQDQA